MRGLIVAASLAVGFCPVAFSQEEAPNREQAQSPDAQSGQLEALLKKLLGAVTAENTDAAAEALRSLIPSKAAVEAVFTKEGFNELGAAVQAHSKQTFAEGPEAALKNLGLSADLTMVDVFSATTEDLMSMETETIAAREFASGLRAVASKLQPGRTFYCAHLYAAGGEDDPRSGARLQLFFFHEDRFVFIGPLWKLGKGK